MSATANVLVGLAISLLALASYLRWWRVAQREHYEPGRLLAMAAIWCRVQPTNLLALAAVLVLCLVGLTQPLVTTAPGLGFEVVHQQLQHRTGRGRDGRSRARAQG